MAGGATLQVFNRCGQPFLRYWLLVLFSECAVCIVTEWKLLQKAEVVLFLIQCSWFWQKHLFIEHWHKKKLYKQTEHFANLKAVDHKLWICGISYSSLRQFQRNNMWARKHLLNFLKQTCFNSCGNINCNKNLQNAREHVVVPFLWWHVSGNERKISCSPDELGAMKRVINS